MFGARVIVTSVFGARVIVTIVFGARVRPKLRVQISVMARVSAMGVLPARVHRRLGAKALCDALHVPQLKLSHRTRGDGQAFEPLRKAVQGDEPFAGLPARGPGHTSTT